MVFVFHFSPFTIRASERANGFEIPEMLRWSSVGRVAPFLTHSLPPSFSQDYPSLPCVAAGRLLQLPRPIPSHPCDFTVHSLHGPPEEEEEEEEGIGTANRLLLLPQAATPLVSLADR